MIVITLFWMVWRTESIISSGSHYDEDLKQESQMAKGHESSKIKTLCCLRPFVPLFTIISNLQNLLMFINFV